jgi:DNA polymerase-1
MTTLIFDIETNGLLDSSTKVHCMVVRAADMVSKAERFGPDEIEQGIARLEQADVLVGHSITRFDLKVLRKLYNWKPRKGVVVEDTEVLSRLAYPDIEGVQFERDSKKVWEFHSLRAWGARLGVLKGDFGLTTDWSEFCEEMLDYCEQDVHVNHALYRKLDRLPAECVRLEHDFARCIHEMMTSGAPFDVEGAHLLEGELNVRRAELTDAVKDLFPPKVTEMKTPQYWLDPETGDRYRVKKEAPASRQRCLERGPNKVKEVPWNPGSRQEIVANLKALGWVPQQFTESGQPKLDDEILKELDYPGVHNLAELFMVEKRLAFLATGDSALLKLARDNRLYGFVNHNGTPTARCRHSRPNLAQVPAPRSPWGKEFRSLFRAPKGFRIVGADADRLELVIQAHYMAYFDGGAYARAVSSGDIHTANQKAAGLETRDQAKTFIYALNYGAGDPKIGSIVGVSEEEARELVRSEPSYAKQVAEKFKRASSREAPLEYLGQAVLGRRLRRRFLDQMPAYAELIKRVKKAAQGKRMRGLDQRPIHVRSEHRAINALFQAGGAVVMKKATVLACEEIERRGLDASLILHVHDEFQFEVREECAAEVAALLEQAIRDAGRALKLQCSLSGTASIGDSWAETH